MRHHFQLYKYSLNKHLFANVQFKFENDEKVFLYYINLTIPSANRSPCQLCHVHVDTINLQRSMATLKLNDMYSFIESAIFQKDNWGMKSNIEWAMNENRSLDSFFYSLLFLDVKCTKKQKINAPKSIQDI